MPEKLTPFAFSQLPGLDDWRVSLGRIEALYRATSFAGAADLVARIAAAADAADHHPDVDLRYPGLVHVVLSTHSTGGLSDLDADLARTISAIAADVGATPEARSGQVTEIAIDAMDIPKVLPFWRAVFGYVDDGEYAIVDPLRIGPPVWFQQMDAPRPQRNRIHLDITVPHDQAQARIDAAVAAGGTLVTDEYARSFWVLADAEGNEACICTWQDRRNSGQP
jgi:4a-hydroxytetrahydrobiopterin dehydratase